MTAGKPVNWDQAIGDEWIHLVQKLNRSLRCLLFLLRTSHLPRIINAEILAAAILALCGFGRHFKEAQ